MIAAISQVEVLRERSAICSWPPPPPLAPSQAREAVYDHVQTVLAERVERRNTWAWRRILAIKRLRRSLEACASIVRVTPE